jgi:hypothetical protein
MATSDYDQLVDMGFDPEKSKFALRKSGGCELSSLVCQPLIVTDDPSG